MMDKLQTSNISIDRSSHRIESLSQSSFRTRYRGEGPDAYHVDDRLDSQQKNGKAKGVALLAPCTIHCKPHRKSGYTKVVTQGREPFFAPPSNDVLCRKCDIVVEHLVLSHRPYCGLAEPRAKYAWSRMQRSLNSFGFLDRFRFFLSLSPHTSHSHHLYRTPLAT